MRVDGRAAHRPPAREPPRLLDVVRCAPRCAAPRSSASTRPVAATGSSATSSTPSASSSSPRRANSTCSTVSISAPPTDVSSSSTTPEYDETLASYPWRRAACRPPRSKPSTQIFLLFTSGTTRRTEGGGVLAGTSRTRRARHRSRPTQQLGPSDVTYASHAAVPLGALFTGVGALDRRGRHAGAAAALLRVRLPARRPQVPRHLLQLRGQAARVHPRHPRTARRRRQPAASAGSATKATKPTCGGSTSASTARSPTGTGRPRPARRSAGCRARPSARSGRAPTRSR